MSSLKVKVQRHKSFRMIGANPLETGALIDDVGIKAENLSDAKPITEEELNELIDTLKAITSNEERIFHVEDVKDPFLFSSADLLRIVEGVTPSVKTRVSFISLLGPRLTNPREEMDTLVGLFRFAEEKSIVENVLRTRANTLNANIFSGKASATYSLSFQRPLQDPSMRSLQREMQHFQISDLTLSATALLTRDAAKLL